MSVSATDKKNQKKKTSKAVEHFLYYSVLFKKKKELGPMCPEAY